MIRKAKEGKAKAKGKWENVRIHPEWLNGLRIKAKQERRTYGNMLQVILEKHGIRKYTKEEFERIRKQIEQIPAEVVA